MKRTFFHKARRTHLQELYRKYGKTCWGYPKPTNMASSQMIVMGKCLLESSIYFYFGFGSTQGFSYVETSDLAILRFAKVALKNRPKLAPKKGNGKESKSSSEFQAIIFGLFASANSFLGGGFKYFLFSSLPGEMVQSD